jgi:predicted DCC family thiol-disulfide oxidoreductase YuxK
MTDPATPSCSISQPAACSLGGKPVDPIPAPEPAIVRTPLNQTIVSIFGLDLRSLALFRIALGFLILYDLFIRAGDMTAFYTDQGILPRADLLRYNSVEAGFSLHMAFGSIWGQSFLFGVSAVLACMLIVGFHTRVANIASWFMLISLQNRNPMAIQSGDTLFNMLLLWGAFLPLGARFSIDSVRNSLPRRTDNLYLGIGTIGLLAQLCFLYFFASYDKDRVMWTSGKAIYLAGHLEAMAKPIMIWLRDYPALHPFMGTTVFYTERLGWLLLFVPFQNQKFRLFTFFWFIGLHINFGLGLAVGIFAWAGMILWLAFLPTIVWDWIFARLATPQRNALTLFYDGNCQFCRQTGLLLRTFFLLPTTSLVPCQSDPEIHKIMVENDSWVVQTADGVRHIRFEGIIEVFRHSPLLFPFAPVMAMEPARSLGDRMYRWICKNRYKLSPKVAWLSPQPMHIRQGVLGMLLGCILLMYVTLLNFSVMDHYKWDLRMNRICCGEAQDVADLTGVYTQPWRYPATILRMQQHWAVFSPQPSAIDGWYVFEAELQDGSKIDLWNYDLPVHFGKPERVWETYRNDRWSKYLETIQGELYAPHRRLLTRYLCKTYNQAHPDNPTKVITLFFLREITDAVDAGPPEPVVIKRYTCPTRPDVE